MIAAVLKQDPAHQAEDGEAVKMERARKAIVEALLGPSLCESGECAVPPVVEAAPPGTVYHFAYGE